MNHDALGNRTLQDVGRALARYRPFVAAVVAMLLIVWLAPGKPAGSDGDGTLLGTGPDSGFEGPGGTEAGADGTGAGAGAEGGTGVAAGGGPGGTAGRGGTATGSGPGSTTGTRPGGRTGSNTGSNAAAGPECDPATGRIRIPTIFAPPCVPPFSGDNGGATTRGVTADEITVVVYTPQRDNAAQGVTQTAGADDTPEEIQQSYREYLDLFQSHYQTYGRKVKFVFMDGSGPRADEAAGRRDVIEIVTKHKAFAVIGNPLANTAYLDEAAARGLVCICGQTQPTTYSLRRAPYIWSPGRTVDQGFVIAAEFIGKQLARKPATWSGTFTATERKIGLIYTDIPDGSYTAGADMFGAELEKHGATLADKYGYQFTPAQAQQEAGTVIKRFKDKGITTIVLGTDPIYPVFFTKEASNQQYFPEWITTGIGLEDTTFFGRTYDPLQWQHAFGLSVFATPVPQATGDAWRLHQWHHGRGPSIKTYRGPYGALFMLFTGIHLGGPKLTPQTFAQGMYAYPPTGGGPTTPALSFGRHGFWPFDDYSLIDDVAMVWWKSDAVGDDEIGGAKGSGMMCFVNGGRRVKGGGFTNTTAPFFDPSKCVTNYNAPPPEDKYPEYEHKHY